MLSSPTTFRFFVGKNSIEVLQVATFIVKKKSLFFIFTACDRFLLLVFRVAENLIIELKGEKLRVLPNKNWFIIVTAVLPNVIL